MQHGPSVYCSVCPLFSLDLVALNLSCIRFHIHQSVMRDTLCCMHCMTLLMRVSYLGQWFFRTRIGSVTYEISRWVLTIFSFCVSTTKENNFSKLFLNSLLIGISYPPQSQRFRSPHERRFKSVYYNEPTHKYRHPILNAIQPPSINKQFV